MARGAGIRRYEAGQHLHRGGLACAVRAKEAQNLAGCTAEAQAVYDRMLAVSLCKAVNFYFYHSVRHDEEVAAQPPGCARLHLLAKSIFCIKRRRFGARRERRRKTTGIYGCPSETPAVGITFDTPRFRGSDAGTSRSPSRQMTCTSPNSH